MPAKKSIKKTYNVLLFRNHPIVEIGVNWNKKIVAFVLFFASFSLGVFAQSLTEAQVKSVYIYNFLQNMKWPSYKTTDGYTIGFLGNETAVYDELKKMASTKKVYDLPIKIIDLNNSTANKTINMLYVSESENAGIKTIVNTYTQHQILMVTNRCNDKTLVMINFVQKDGGIIQFEINKPNLIYEKLSISDKFILKGGTELDAAELYRKMETELQNLKEVALNQQLVLNKLNTDIDEKNRQLYMKEIELKRIQLGFINITDSFNRLSAEYDEKKQSLTAKELEFEQLINSITDLNAHLSAQQKKIDERNAEISKKEIQINAQNSLLERQIKQIKQHKEKDLEQTKTIQNQYYVNIIAGIIIISIIVLLSQYFRSLKKEKQTNEIILNQNKMLTDTSAQLLVAKNAAELASKAKSNFLSNMSHELRTPLHAILGYSEKLQTEENLNKQQINSLATVHNSGKHLLSLINDLLDFGQIEADKIEIASTDFKLSSVLNTVFNIVLINAQKKDLNMYFEPTSELPEYVTGDERRLKQILLNLLSNAVKYTEKGEVRFKVGYPYAGKNIFRAEIEDTGEGIKPEFLTGIFDAFVQVSSNKNYIEGTGLGLSITKKFVELMNGNISVVSVPEKGSIFAFEIPLEIIASTNELGSIGKINIIGYTGKSKSILVIDDTALNLKFLTDILEPLGFKVLTAYNSNSAIEILSENSIDLIFLDYLLPDSDGLSILKKIRTLSNHKETPIIGNTAATIYKAGQKAFIDACTDHLIKPFSNKSLFGSIEKTLNLQWKYNTDANEELNNAFNSSAEIIFPPADILKQINAYAEHGAFAKIEELVQILSSNKEFYAFCSRISKLTANFDDDGIMALTNNKTD